jgi:hypothetical protein
LAFGKFNPYFFQMLLQGLIFFLPGFDSFHRAAHGAVIFDPTAFLRSYLSPRPMAYQLKAALSSAMPEKTLRFSGKRKRISPTGDSAKNYLTD